MITDHLRSGTSAVVALALVVSAFGFMSLTPTRAAEGDVTVSISAFVDGELATEEGTGSFSFPMNASWNATSTGEGSGSFSLDASGGYETETALLSAGAMYALEADTSAEGLDTSCGEGTEYALAGYTVGETFAEAEAGTPSMDAPEFTDLTTNQYVIVWYEDCTPAPAEDAQITITKYLDGELATAESASSTAFSFTATWDDPDGIGAGSSDFTLDASGEYEAQSVAFMAGADYSVEENLDGTTVAETCGAADYRLVGYTWGATRAEAEGGTATTTAPAFTDLSSDQYVIVWNETCTDEEPGDGTLAVRSTEALDSSGVANGDWEDGWVYVFHLTVPDDETSLAMRFSDWTDDELTMAVGNNIRIMSEQASSTDYAYVTAASTYTSELTITGDLDPDMPGMQVEVRVEVRIPEGTENGTYSTTYGIRTQ